MKKKKNEVYRRSVSLLAAAAMTAVLMTGQIYPAAVWGQNTETRLEESSLIPENITIDEPVALSEVALPKSDYGTLSWVDDSYVPDKRTQSCKVIFKPAADVDLSYLSGWDAEKKVVKGKITVVVSSLEEDSKEETESGTENKDTSESDNSVAVPENTTTPTPTEENAKCEESINNEEDIKAEEDIKNEEGTENNNESQDNAAEEDETSEPAPANENTSLNGENNSSEETTTGEADEQEKTDSAVSVIEGDNAAADQQESVTGNNEADVSADVVESFGKVNEALGVAMPGATVLGGSEDSTDKETTENTDKESPEEKKDSAQVKDATDDEQKNIFDNPLDFTVADTRPSEAEEDLTEEEQAARAAENHTCEGISVSGIDLPWYVQFQVTSGENYEFKNENKATIFQSYEFKLWDLRNNTEYEIPDGQYVSVTIPVKEGYEYSIEHLLDNGATETIIPSVNGNTMVFSTHSFSPFGIAGFRPLVGEDIANGAYDDKNTLTPTPTGIISGTPSPSPSVTGTVTNGSPSNNETTSGNEGMGSSTTNSSTGGAASATPGAGTAGTTNSTGNGTGNISGAASEEGTGGTTGTTGTTSGVSGTNAAITGTPSNQNAGQSQVPNNSQSQATNNSQSQTSNAVKTGDNTVILPFVILVLAAAAVIIIVIIVRNKKDK